MFSKGTGVILPGYSSNSSLKHMVFMDWPCNEQIGTFNKIVVNAQNVLVLTGKTDISKSPRQDMIT